MMPSTFASPHHYQQPHEQQYRHLASLCIVNTIFIIHNIIITITINVNIIFVSIIIVSIAITIILALVIGQKERVTTMEDAGGRAEGTRHDSVTRRRRPRLRCSQP
jgi:hypothetical protein